MYDLVITGSSSLFYSSHVILRETIKYYVYAFNFENNWKGIDIDTRIHYPKEVVDYLLLLQREGEL